MPTPRKGYFLSDGSRVPGVTTVIGKFRDPGALMYWAWKEGTEGRDYKDTRQRAADAGTAAHAMVDADIHGVAFDPSPYPDDVLYNAETSFLAYLEWKRQTNLAPVVTEVQMVSEAYRYGGTPDALMLQGRLSLGDWKTGNGVYAEHLIQLAAYRALWEENHPNQPIVGGFHLLRFEKEHGDFHHHYWGDLGEAWEAFKHMRALYDLVAALSKRVK